MRRILSITIIVSAFAGLLFAQEANLTRALLSESSEKVAMLQSSRSQSREANRATTSRPRRRIDFMADDVLPYNKGKDSVVYFLGHFAAHHNGAVIACDSAVRYNDTRWGFFGNAIINQDSIYIYGDSAIYNGDISLAEVYAPVVKVIDGDALLYTYNFRFNTDKKIGTYTGGGVLVQDNDILESQRGFYYADEHNIICVEDVELHGSDYDMKSDSVIYNTETKFARFFANTEIWNSDDEYLSANAGYYDNSQNLYVITEDGYILTAEQEIWGDTLSYYRDTEHIIANNDIQMDDIKNKMLAFGDYAEFWGGDMEIALLTKRPVSISYDLEQGDSVFMSADTMQFLTISRLEEAREMRNKEIADSIAAAEKAVKERQALLERRQKFLEEQAIRDSIYRIKQDSIKAAEALQDSLRRAADTMALSDKVSADSVKEAGNTESIDSLASDSIKEDSASDIPKDDTATKAKESREARRAQRSQRAQKSQLKTEKEQREEQKQKVQSTQQEQIAEQKDANDNQVENIANVSAQADTSTQAGISTQTKELGQRADSDNVLAEVATQANTTAATQATTALSTDTSTQNPTTQQNNTLSESIAPQQNDSIAKVPTLPDSLNMQLSDTGSLAKDSLIYDFSMPDSLAIDSLGMDSLMSDSLRLDTLTAKERKAYFKSLEKRAKDAEKRAKMIARKKELDSIGLARRAKIVAEFEQNREREMARLAKDSVRRAEKRVKLLAKGRDVSALDAADSLAELEREKILSDSLPDFMYDFADSIATDSLSGGGMISDSLARDSLSMDITDSLSADSVAADTLYRVVKAYRKVRIYRSDAQAICDSLVSSDTDSIIHMYIEPVMWNNNNQIAAAQVDAYTANQQLLRAEFLENPIMVAEIDTSYYNQVTGKQMTAYFRNNEIYRNDVDGNVQTIYFQREDEESAIVTELVYLESASASFYIEDKEVVGITYRNDVPFEFYPIALIPENQMRRLPNFKWVPELRPTRENIFDRTIRPSRREQTGERNRPKFRIVEKMDRYKERMMRQGLWIDREDELTPEIIEWRDSRERD